MRKITTLRATRRGNFNGQQLTIGLDLGDRFSFYCVLDEAGEVILEQKLPTIPESMRQAFEKMPRSRMALETDTHSPWVSRQLTALGHEVIVAHARNVRLIGESSRKDDRIDARTLARLARIDPGLLGPVRHRSATAQIHLTVIRARAALVSTRTALVNAARGLTKSYGERLRKCGTGQMNREIAKGLSQELRESLGAAVAGNRIVERARHGIRPADRPNRPGSASGGRAAQTGKGDRNTNCVDLRSDSERSAPLSPQPGCGMLSGVASWAQELWHERAADAHQQRRRPLSENADRARCTLHSRAFWRGQ
jgi:transposase